MICAPSTFSWLPPNLRTVARTVCQRVLTVGKRARSGVLERLEGLVVGKGLGEVLGGLRIEVVVAQTADKSQIRVSAGVSSQGRASGCQRTSMCRATCWS